MQDVLRTVELNCEQAKDLKPDIYLRYQAAYELQGNPNQRTRPRHALRTAMRLLAEYEPPGKAGRPKTHGYVEAIARDAKLSEPSARIALETARRVRRILREAEVLLTRANPPALEDPGWTRGFSNMSSTASTDLVAAK